MTDIAIALKNEITRLARKELRVQLEPLKKTAAHSKAQIAELRAEVGALKAQLKQLGKKTQPVGRTPAIETPRKSRQRFTAEGFATMRSRLGLSCAEMGALIGASDQSVRKWEDGSSIPREKFRQVIFELRDIGKREIASKLANEGAR